MRQKVITILSSIRPEASFADSTDFLEDGLLDSFDMVSLVSALDEEFGISIDGVDIVPENFTNMDTIEALLRKSGVAE